MNGKHLLHGLLYVVTVCYCSKQDWNLWPWDVHKFPMSIKLEKHFGRGDMPSNDDNMSSYWLQRKSCEKISSASNQEYLLFAGLLNVLEIVWMRREINFLSHIACPASTIFLKSSLLWLTRSLKAVKKAIGWIWLFCNTSCAH